MVVCSKMCRRLMKAVVESKETTIPFRSINLESLRTKMMLCSIGNNTTKKDDMGRNFKNMMPHHPVKKSLNNPTEN